jgi:predicted DCC family thiol-disulfide oxidoreductase YuxK
VRERDRGRRVRLIGVEGELEAVEVERPGGRRLRGARAVAEVLWTLGGGWRLAAFACRLPGSELGYRAVAALRSRLPGDPAPPE